MSTAKFTRKPLLSTVQEVHFQRGSTKLHWKTSIDDDVFETGDCLKKRVAAMLQHGHQTFGCKSKDASTQKKKVIVDKLCPQMSDS